MLRVAWSCAAASITCAGVGMIWTAVALGDGSGFSALTPLTVGLSMAAVLAAAALAGVVAHFIQ